MSETKAITFAIPCYNSAAYMDTCLQSLVGFGDDVEILIVNDGSTDGQTLSRAKSWEERFPQVVRVIDQENRGHGGAVNRGLVEASGLYFKVVDSDDWLDADETQPILDFIRSQCAAEKPCDMVVGNYIYDKVHEGKKQTISYRNVFPTGRVFAWQETRRFRSGQYLLMHSVFYRTQLLKDMGLELPEHCFYVDNIFVYEPLPQVETIRYFDKNVYHYYIGREDQSVNEKTMLSRIDQQIRITKCMIDAVDLSELEDTKVAGYMYNYLSMMMCICSTFLRMEPSPENERKREEIWSYLRETRPGMYAKVRASIVNLSMNLPTRLGRAFGLGGYRIARRIFKFN